jgi:antitoxin (DNA-binding transcriptional repressor) of toxin-antitoxin stability system
MKTITLDELHEETDQWVRQAAQFGEILVTDHGKSVAKLVPLSESPRDASFKTWQPSPEFAAIMQRPVGGTDSTQIISEDRDRT